MWPMLHYLSAGNLPYVFFFQLVDSAKALKFLEVDVKTATTNTLIAVEILTWFCVGEIVGRWHLIGYKVPTSVAH